MDRALLVLDQVSHTAVDRELTARGLALSAPVRLDYLPRTTPVGHATISTGAPPSTHRVQGRTWFEQGPPLVRHRINDVVALVPPLPAGPLHHVRSHSLAARLRTTDTASIVAVAAKDFIPFLFGAWDCDVTVYPFDVAPGPLTSTSSTIVFQVVFVAWTTSGEAALAAAMPRVRASLARMIPPGAVSMPAVSTRPLGTSQPLVVQEMWAIPSSWGSASGSYNRHWNAHVAANADLVDDSYTEIGVLLTSALPQPRALLQSCFATDFHGHRSGPSSPSFARSLAAGIDRALGVAALGFRVGVTSDHGGRDTPTVLGYDATAGTLDGRPLPTALVHFKDGDHVVGYGSTLSPTYWTVSAVGLTPVAVPPTIAARSHHADQVPAWKVCGDLGARVDMVTRPPGGGDHGMCASGGVLSSIDNEVFAWSPNGVATHHPATLDHIAAWFLGLT